MIFVDSNIPMYLVGALHANRDLAIQALERLIKGRERLVTSAEVFQEVLHRYVAIRRPDAISPAFNMLSEIVDEVFAVAVEDVFEAKNILTSEIRLSARDALHCAVMRRRGISTIFSFDQGFDTVSGVTRIPGPR